MFRTFVAVAGILCVAVCAALIGWREYALRSTVRVPVDVAFPAEPSRLPVRTFTLERSGKYDVVVSIDRSPDESDRARAECLLGFDPGNPQWGLRGMETPCREAPVVDLTWHLTSDIGPVVDGTGEPSEMGRVSGLAAGGTFGADETDRWLGTFEAEPGRRYTLTVETHANAAALQPFSPRLLVQPSSSIIRDEHLTTTVVWAIGGWFGTVGLGLLGFAAWLDRRARRGAGSSG